MTKKQFQDGDKVPSWKDVSGNASHLHAESISTQPVYQENVMAGAERLAEWLEEKAHNHAQDDIVEWSRMVETAALLRTQSARIAALEDEVKALSGMLEEADRHAQEGWGKAFKALGKGSK